MQTDEVKKRVRVVKDHDVAGDLELANMRSNLSNVHQQLTNLASVTTAVPGAFAGRTMISGGGGALSGLLGFGSGGGRVSPPSTSLLQHTTRTLPTPPRAAAPPMHVTSRYNYLCKA